MTATAATGTTTAAAITPPWLLLLELEEDWMDAPVADAPDALSVLLAEFVNVEVMNKVLTAVPSELATDCVTMVVVCGATDVLVVFEDSDVDDSVVLV